MCVTSCYYDDCVWVLAMNAMYGLSVFMVCVVGYGAGVDDADVCFFSLFSTGMTSVE